MLEIKKYWGSVIHFTPLRVPVGQLALYGRVQIWQNQAKGLGLRVIPTLVVIAYIDNIYTVGKVISLLKKEVQSCSYFKKFLNTFWENPKKIQNNKNLKKIFTHLIQSISMHINGI